MDEPRLRPEYEHLQDLFERIGLEPAGARLAAIGREPLGEVYADPFDRLVGQFQQIGMSEADARIAATGRGRSEREVREEYAAEIGDRAYGIRVRTDAERRQVEEAMGGLVAAYIAKDGGSVRDGQRRAARIVRGYLETSLTESSAESFVAVINQVTKLIASPVSVAESAIAVATRPVVLVEASRFTKGDGRLYRARLIEGERWGASGYYPRTMLERDGPSVFQTGLPVYFDHPTATENAERPERSVRDLAGRLTTAAAYETDGLYANVEVYPHAATIIEGMAGDIGMSIRAAGIAEHGEAAGRTGPIITALTEAHSVDFVTRAGAGGKLIQPL